ncbi:MAG: hypothetical protein RIM84_23325 [Alphaproteobacteria bacterium]
MFAAPRSARPLARVRHRLLPLATAACLAAASPAQAELDAEKIKVQVQKAIDQYVEMTDGALQPQGSVNVVEDGDAIVVTTPAMVVEGPDSRIEVPSSLVRLTETDADHIAFTLTLPNEITGVKQGSVPDKLLITIGGQQIEGAFRPSLLTFEKLDLRLDDIAGSVNDGSFSLGALRLNLANIEDAPGKWRSDAGFALGELRVMDAEKTQLVAIGRIENAWRIDQYDLPAFAEIQRKMTGGSPFMGMPKPDDEVVQQAMQEMIQRLPELFDGANGGGTFRIAGLQVAAIQQPPFSLGAASIDLGLAPEEALYGLQLGLNVDKPEIDPMASPVPPHLLPRSAVADLGLRRLPLGQLWQMVSVPMQQAMKLEMSGKMTPEAEAEINEQFEMVPFAAMGMAGEAGSFAEIKSIEIELGPAKLSVAGVGPLLPGMPEPALNILAKIEGLDDLAAEVQKLDKGMADQIMPVIVMLRGLGKAVSENDRIVHTYQIAEGKQGEITVNGVNVDELQPK